MTDKKRGRPAAIPGQSRTKHMSVYASDKELAQIRRAAAEDGMTVSEWVRQLARVRLGLTRAS